MIVLAAVLGSVIPVLGEDAISGENRRPDMSHKCPSNQEVQAAMREGRTVKALAQGAAAGCAKCRANLNWLHRSNRERYGISTTTDEKVVIASRREDLKDCEPKATPPAARLQEQTAAPAQTVTPAQPAGAVPPHRCHSNQEVQAVIRGSATHRDVQYGASLGCPRCRENLIWWEERQQARDEALRTHVCPSNAAVMNAIRGGATHKALIRGANAGCAKCRSNLNWWNKRH